jgi:hypothetical protein
MEQTVIAALGPIASAIAAKLASGDRIKDGERSFLLLYSMAGDMKDLRTELFALSTGIRELRGSINELRVDVARLNGKLGER